jgi:cytochrome c oxidase subunit 3
LLLATMVHGIAFLGIKAYEYSEKYHHQHIPGFGLPYHFEGEFGEQTKLFFAMYFTMTGVHALHMLIGLTMLAILVGRAMRYPTTTENYMPVEISGLYWHLIDLVWIYLYPTLYLIDFV